jgi:hypothetical protein
MTRPKTALPASFSLPGTSDILLDPLHHGLKNPQDVE